VKIIAFAASSSSKSINKKLVTYAANLSASNQVEILDLNNYELPLFSIDKEFEIGKPQLAQDFLEKINNCDALIISFAEHNGSYCAAYKNIFDWCSRINQKVFQGKKMALFSTSPGARGGASVLEAAVKSAPLFGGKVVGNLSVPSFGRNFDENTGKMINDQINSSLIKIINDLTK
jgi:NAD(P)H-dependent FMN reductase